jgi:hypothetical protein
MQAGVRRVISGRGGRVGLGVVILGVGLWLWLGLGLGGDEIDVDVDRGEGLGGGLLRNGCRVCRSGRAGRRIGG